MNNPALQKLWNGRFATRSVILLGLILSVKTVSAAAPSKIDLSYDYKTQTLHIDVNHITHDRNKHYIKKIEIRQNGEGPQTLYFRLQVNRTHFITDVPLEAQEGDAVEVKATDSDGGSRSDTIVVPPPPEEE